MRTWIPLQEKELLQSFSIDRKKEGETGVGNGGALWSWGKCQLRLRSILYSIFSGQSIFVHKRDKSNVPNPGLAHELVVLVHHDVQSTLCHTAYAQTQASSVQTTEYSTEYLRVPSTC